MLGFLSDPDVRASARAHRMRLLFGALAMAGRGACGLAVPYFLGLGIDQIGTRAPDQDRWRTLFALVAFALATACFQFWMRWLWIGWSRDGEQSLRHGVFRHLMSLPVPYFHRSRTGDLMSRLTSDVEAVRMGFGPGLMHAIATTMMAATGLALMISHSPTLTGVVLLPLAGLFLSMRGLLPRIHRESTAVQERQADLSARSQESFSGARVVKTFARENHEESRFSELSRSYFDASVRLATTRALFRGSIELFATATLVVIVLYGGHLVLQEQITIGEFVAFNGYLQMLIWPTIAMGWTLSLFKRAEAAEQRLRSLRLAEPEPVQGASRTPGPGALEVRDLTFTHPGSPGPALQGVSFSLEPGGTLGIVGATASGKSTLVSLICRLLEPPRGTVFLDGADARSLDLHAVRRAISLVPQDTFLFSDTIAANVAFGRDGAAAEEIERAAYLACLDEAVASFPEGYDTMVGERGVSLSGGQRQRTAIARALLVGAPILILDDCLSAVDTETEQRILGRIRPEIERRTTLLVSHRVSTVQHAGEILVLEGGSVVERGAHAELLALGGRYAELHRLQQEAEELEHL